MNEQLTQKILACPTLPSLPAIAVQVLNLAQKPEVDIPEIAKAISKDPALSGKILRTVNSSFYARRQAVATINQAVVILGLQSVKTLVLGFSLVSNLSATKSKGFKHLTYWKRSIYSATAARVIAAKINLVEREEAFMGSLLNDIGMLVLDQVLGAQYGEICSKITSHADLGKVERESLGMTHADVGALLAKQWKLPPILTTPIAYSHNSQQTPDPALKKLAILVELAGHCGDVFVDESPASSIAAVRSTCAAQYQMSPADCDAMLQEIAAKTKEVATLFEINIGAAADFESVLKKANETLVELTLQTQMQASHLQEMNAQLKEQANTDALTKLANRARFEAFIFDEFAKVSASAPLTLFMMDLDKFKKVNDAYGHPAGDAVLKHVAAIVGSMARAGDLAVRFGGEEMILVLPGTHRDTATMIAESLRRAVCGKPVSFDGKNIPVTISIGIAVTEPGSPLVSPAHLIKAADLAVYAAKNGGRNCIRVFSLPAKAAA